MTTSNSIDSNIPISTAQGGSGTVSLLDGGILLGSGTGAITALDLSSKGSLLVGDGTTDPVALAVGTNDYVLTADSAQASGTKWAAAAAGGGNGLVFLASATASTSATLEFSTNIDSTYNSYFFVFDALIPASNNVWMFTRTSSDGGSTFDSGSTDYKYQIFSSYSVVVFTSAGGNTTNMKSLGSTQGNGSTDQYEGQMILVNPSASTLTSAYFSNAVNRLY